MGRARDRREQSITYLATKAVTSDTELGNVIHGLHLLERSFDDRTGIFVSTIQTFFIATRFLLCRLASSDMQSSEILTQQPLAICSVVRAAMLAYRSQVVGLAGKGRLGMGRQSW